MKRLPLRGFRAAILLAWAAACPAAVAPAGAQTAAVAPRAAVDPSETPPALPVAWESGIGRGATAPPLAAAGRLYVATARQEVKALESATGRELWSRKLGKGFQAAPVLAEGVLLVASPHPDANAYGLDPATGATRWRRKVGDVMQAPIAGEGRAVFVSLVGRVSALAPASGDVLWETRLEGVFPGGALLGSGRLILLSAEGVLHRLDAGTGAQLGTRDLEGAVAPALLPLDDGRGFLVASYDGRVRGFDLALNPLATDWRAAPLLHPPAGGAQRLVVPGKDRVLRAFEATSGEPLWERAFPVAFAAPPALSGDGSRVAVGDLAGSVWTLVAEDGTLLSRTSAGHRPARPAWADGGWVVVTEEGTLLWLSPSEPEPGPGAGAGAGTAGAPPEAAGQLPGS